MCSTRLILLSCTLLACANAAAAQTVDVSYTIPCQSREAFLSRLRSLVRQPDAADAALREFQVFVEQNAEASWTLTVSRNEAATHLERSVHDASCESVAEAAALVVAAWIDESPPPAAAAPPIVAVAAPVATPAPAPAPAPVPEPQPEKPSRRQGASLVFEGATALIPGLSGGGSVEFWTLSPDAESLTSFGFTYWPMAAALDAGELVDEHYQRPTWEVFVKRSALLLDLGAVRFGPYGALHVGSRRSQDDVGSVSNVFTARLGFGAAVRWELARTVALRMQLGAAAHLGSAKLTATASLALDVTIF
jgi:hypothetical protein